jgi:hypothetical protein
MKILGIVLILWGIADIGLNWIFDTDVYYSLGIQLPEEIWTYSHFISIAIGYGIYKLGEKLQE